MKYDIIFVGPISIDYNIDCNNNTDKNLGGAVVYSPYAARTLGVKCCVYTKFNQGECSINKIYQDSKIDVFYKESKQTCSIENRYLTEDKEIRICTSLGKCDEFTFEEISNIKARVYYFAGLVCGDFNENIFKMASTIGKVAVDVQCLLRYIKKDKSMDFRDWKNKKEYLQYIDFLKTDAKEAFILTGEDDRYKAAKTLCDFGAKEIMITHNTEVIIYDGNKFYSYPIKSRNFKGRTGRGDTAFGAYVAMRLNSDIDSSLKYATALVSLKMEESGPFKGTVDDVNNYIKEFY